MRMTPNEVRARIRSIRDAGDRWHSMDLLIDLIEDVAPELVALSSGRSLEDAGRRYRDDEGRE